MEVKGTIKKKVSGKRTPSKKVKLIEKKAAKKISKTDKKVTTPVKKTTSKVAKKVPNRKSAPKSNVRSK